MNNINCNLHQLVTTVWCELYRDIHVMLSVIYTSTTLQLQPATHSFSNDTENNAYCFYDSTIIIITVVVSCSSSSDRRWMCGWYYLSHCIIIITIIIMLNSWRLLRINNIYISTHTVTNCWPQNYISDTWPLSAMSRTRQLYCMFQHYQHHRSVLNQKATLSWDKTAPGWQPCDSDRASTQLVTQDDRT